MGVQRLNLRLQQQVCVDMRMMRVVYKWLVLDTEAGTWPELLSGAGCLSAHQDPLAPVFAHICQKCACH